MKRRKKKTTGTRNETQKRTIKRLLLILVSVVLIALLAVTTVLWNADSDSSSEEQSPEASEQRGQSSSGAQSGGELSDPSSSTQGTDLGYRAPITISREEQVYLGYDASELEAGLEAYEAEYESDFNLPDNAVGEFSDPNASTNSDSQGQTYTPGEDINPGDVSADSASIRYYIEQLQRDSEDVGPASLLFPSRQAGYSNNPSNYELSDGDFNPLYSYVLAEDVQYFYGHHLQRLLNPVYGSWWQAQMGENYPYRFLNSVHQLEDMFTPEWWENNVVNGSVANLPIMADWSGDNFGEMTLTDGPRWFAEIESHDLTVSDGDRIQSVIALRFVTFTEDDERLERTGELRLTVEPNVDVHAINNRLVISQARLDIEQG